jgi:N-sulfoglucosamine sulfohydrolase
MNARRAGRIVRRIGPRRSRPLWSVVAAFAFCSARAAGEADPRRDRPAAPPARPNILWITAEDMNCQLGCYGDPYAETPNLDRLASQGVRYTRAFATAPVCSPARSCLITGLYATTLGTHNLRSRFPLPRAAGGFPALLRAAGYYCTNNVKTDYNTSDEPALIAASWDESSPKAHWRTRKPGQPFFAVFNCMETHQSRTFEAHEAMLSKRLKSAERRDPAKAPLPPYYPDTPAARRTVARFYDGIGIMDRDHAGRLLRELEEDGLAENTIVFFFGDNGMGMPRGKRTLYDAGLRVALIVRFPKAHAAWAPAAPGGTTDRPVSFVDFAPTVLSLAGLPAPPHLQGIAFLGPAARPPRDATFGARDRVDEAFDLSRSVRDGRYLYLRNYMPHLSPNQPEFYSNQASLRREIASLAEQGKLDAVQRSYGGPHKPLEELYDVEADPHQVRNLAHQPEHKATRTALRRRLRAWILETRDLGFLPESEMVRRCDGAAPFDMARRPDAYPLERILEAAEQVGQADARPRQQALLRDTDPAVRYWAAVGLHALGKQADAARDALADALRDDSPCVRIEAAAALAGLHDDPCPPTLDVLARELRSDRKDVALRAARALQLLGEKARPALPAMEAALAEAKADPGDPALFIRFALEPAVATLRTANR